MRFTYFMVDNWEIVNFVQNHAGCLNQSVGF